MKYSPIRGLKLEFNYRKLFKIEPYLKINDELTQFEKLGFDRLTADGDTLLMFYVKHACSPTIKKV